MGLLGGGVAMLVGTVGVVNVAVAGSVGRGRFSAPSTGGMISAGFQRASRKLNISVSGTYSTAGYRDIAAEYGSPVPKATINASLGYQLGEWGNIGIAYNRRISRRQPVDSPGAEPDHRIIADSQVELVTGSYSIPVAGRATFYATGFKDLSADDVYGLGLGISFALGGSTFAAETSLDSGRSTSSLSISKSAQKQNDFGYRLRDSEGAAPRRSVEGEFLSRWGRLSAGVDQSADQITGRAGASGALVLAGGNLFAGDQIHDSFAVVSTGDVAGVPVLYENRPVGITDSRGMLLVPSLLSYQDNRLTVDATKLPPDIEVGQTAILVRPPDRSGVVVDFGIRKVNAALLTLHDSKGRPVPLGLACPIRVVHRIS